MSTAGTGLRLTTQEALARELILERVASRHRAQRRRHPSRTAVLLRSLADRLDHTGRADGDHAEPPTAAAGPHAVGQSPRAGLHEGPHAGQPRPWSARVRRAPHRHSS
jgi:hypothetical protein